MQISSNQQNFCGAHRIYFYTNDGKRIVSDENMKKCLHYVEAHLNGSKRVKTLNRDLIDNFRFGQKDAQGARTGGDKDYFYYSKIRAVFKKMKDRKDGFVRILTGQDVDVVNQAYGMPIGVAKRMGIERAGSAKTFESSYAVDRYYDQSVRYADKRIEQNPQNKKAFGVAFTPIYKKNGEIKGFEYHHSAYFDENLVNPSSKQI